MTVKKGIWAAMSLVELGSVIVSYLTTDYIVSTICAFNFSDCLANFAPTFTAE